MTRSSLLLASLLLVALAIPAAAELPNPRLPISHVAASEGRAIAGLAGEANRVLSCGDPVYADERIATAPGARLVLAQDGRHAHLGSDAVLVLRRAAEDETVAGVERGGVRLLDAAEHPVIHVATPAGTLALPGADFELRRAASGAVEICEWSGTRAGACRSVESSGRVAPFAKEGPGIDRGFEDVCVWEERVAVSDLDFTSMPDIADVATVASGLGAPSDSDPHGPEPGCSGDECAGPPSFEPGDMGDIQYSVAQPPIFVPEF